MKRKLRSTIKTRKPMPNTISNKTLQEIVFEVKYKDPSLINYDLLVGELFSKLKNKYPFFQLLKPKEIPALLMPFIVQHRFRKDEGKYPLYQLGPGILSFNVDGKAYSSFGTTPRENYKSELSEFLSSYRDVAAEKFITENFEHFSLRMLFAIEDSDMYPNVKDYFDNKLNFKIDLGFATGIEFIANLEHNQISQNYFLDQEKKTKFRYEITTITEGARKLLVDLSVVSSEAPPYEGIQGWLDTSFNQIETFYSKLTSKIQKVIT
jgi:uncharacterized protein (TIGR04255 family)